MFAIRLVPGKAYQPSLKFAVKTGAYLREASLKCFTLGYATCHTQTVNKGEKACQGHLILLWTFVNYGCKSFVTLGRGCLVSRRNFNLTNLDSFLSCLWKVRWRKGKYSWNSSVLLSQRPRLLFYHSAYVFTPSLDLTLSKSDITW